MEKYTWIAECYGDNNFHDGSINTFNSKKEVFNDMRNAALLKMKSDTEYEEEYFNTDEYEGTIDYNMVISHNEIVLTSYSGEFVYKVIRIE